VSGIVSRCVALRAAIAAPNAAGAAHPIASQQCVFWHVAPWGIWPNPGPSTPCRSRRVSRANKMLLGHYDIVEKLLRDHRFIRSTMESRM
jgi:hypothetical protein